LTRPPAFENTRVRLLVIADRWPIYLVASLFCSSRTKVYLPHQQERQNLTVSGPWLDPRVANFFL
jgi:hypothetical protein